MASAREFFSSPKGRPFAIGLVILGILAVGYSAWSSFRDSDAVNDANNRLFIDAKTGELFRVKMKPGVTIPVEAPSGGKTGYEPERCYWTKDGKVKEEPTYVLLNQYAGKPEPTFCPDCGRLVKLHNPPPLTGSKPPPTRSEYDARNDRR